MAACPFATRLWVVAIRERNLRKAMGEAMKALRSMGAGANGRDAEPATQVALEARVRTHLYGSRR